MLREWGQVRGGGNQSEGMSLTDHEAESWRPMSGTDPPTPEDPDSTADKLCAALQGSQEKLGKTFGPG